MKVITEAILRLELKCSEPEYYYIPEGKILSPAAREYLQQRKIKIGKGPAPAAAPAGRAPNIVATEVLPMPSVPMEEGVRAKFVDYETGAFYTTKPEHMTHLSGNVLVPKNHPRIMFRGKLDSLQALYVLTQAELFAAGSSQKLIDDLGGMLGMLREMMRCEVLDEPFHNERLLGLSHEELHERSHNPMKFYSIKQMVLPDYTMGRDYALLNRLRTAVRETEVAASDAFHEGKRCTRPDVIEELNRLSSAMHIMMCMYLAGEYRQGGQAVGTDR